MPFESLQEYVKALEGSNQLKRVKSKVSVDLELAEILRRVMYSNGPAVLFEDVDGFKIPILGNAFGNMERMKLALETDNFEEIGERIVGFTKMQLPTGMLDKIKMLPKLSEIADNAPKVVSKGPVSEVYEDSSKASFNSFPAFKC